jgi:hypothetical protein
VHATVPAFNEKRPAETDRSVVTGPRFVSVLEGIIADVEIEAVPLIELEPGDRLVPANHEGAGPRSRRGDTSMTGPILYVMLTWVMWATLAGMLGDSGQQMSDDSHASDGV